MSDPTTTPTPTNEQQDVRMVIDYETAWDTIEANIYLTPEAKVEVQTILDTLAHPLAVVSAAAPDKREALYERLPERFRFSREIYGDVADDATRVLLAVTDGGHGIVPDDNLRWIAITAAQALAARPAPVVSGEARTPDESCISGAAEHAGAAADDEGGQE